MSNPYPPYHQPKKLERSRDNKVLGGVCAGIANYLNMDPTLVRVLFVALGVCFGFPVVLYILALFLMPEESRSPDQLYPRAGTPGSEWGQGSTTSNNSGLGYPPAPGYQPGPGFPPQYAPSGYPQAAPVPPPYGRGPNTDPVWGAAGAPWEQPYTEPTPTPTEPTPTEPTNQDLSTDRSPSNPRHQSGDQRS